jgi:hypothetical protein
MAIRERHLNQFQMNQIGKMSPLDSMRRNEPRHKTRKRALLAANYAIINVIKALGCLNSNGVLSSFLAHFNSMFLMNSLATLPTQFVELFDANECANI